MTTLSLGRSASAFSNLGPDCSFLLGTLCLVQELLKKSKRFRMQKIQDALDLVEMEGGSSPMGHAFLKAISSSFQKRPAHCPVPKFILQCSTLSSKKQRKHVYNRFHHTVSNPHLWMGSWSHRGIPPMTESPSPRLGPQVHPGPPVILNFVCSFI